MCVCRMKERKKKSEERGERKNERKTRNSFKNGDTEELCLLEAIAMNMDVKR